MSAHTRDEMYQAHIDELILGMCGALPDQETLLRVEADDAMPPGWTAECASLLTWFLAEGGA